MSTKSRHTRHRSKSPVSPRAARPSVKKAARAAAARKPAGKRAK